MTTFAVEISQLAEVVWVSLAAGVGIAISFSLVVYGSARSTEARRQGQAVAAFAYVAMAVLFLCLFLGSVVFGVHIMLKK